MIRQLVEHLLLDEQKKSHCQAKFDNVSLNSGWPLKQFEGNLTKDIIVHDNGIKIERPQKDHQVIMFAYYWPLASSF
jgi:hypothetical protein